MPADDDYLSLENVRDPYPFFAGKRTDEPVDWNEQSRAWFIHRYDDVLDMLRAPETFSSDRIWSRATPASEEGLRSGQEILSRWFVFKDPPSHTRLRQTFAREFTPRAIEKWRPRVEDVVADTVERTLSTGTTVDLVRDFAAAIPATVIADMLGVPEQDRHLVQRWAHDIMVLVFGAREVADSHVLARQGLSEMDAYLRELIRDLRRHPGENLISRVVAPPSGVPSVDDEELVASCSLFLFGGQETTTNLIANGFRALMAWPSEYERLRRDPDLLKLAVEELLRFDGPSKTELRVATHDVVLRGRTIHRGDMVYLVQASANRDESVFSAADRLELSRDGPAHVAFGFGAHFCLGASLARLEGACALRALMRHVRDPVSPGTESWIPTIISRGMDSFPISYEYVPA